MENHSFIKVGVPSSIRVKVALRSVGRVTINLNQRDHLAFKLLSLQQNKKLVVLMQDAMHNYLQSKGAYDLVIESKISDVSEP